MPGKTHLFVKRSGIPKAGRGLFTRKHIVKGTRIIEYKGKITTWQKVLESDEFNAYVFYVNRNHVIDAKNAMSSFGRYANDANGLYKKNSLINNSKYIKIDGRVFIQATRDIPAGSEILVSYKKEYWDVIKYNSKLASRTTNI